MQTYVAPFPFIADMQEDCELKKSSPSVLSLKGEGTDGPGEAQGVTKTLSPICPCLPVPTMLCFKPAVQHKEPFTMVYYRHRSNYCCHFLLVTSAL